MEKKKVSHSITMPAFYPLSQGPLEIVSSGHRVQEGNAPWTMGGNRCI